jgi:hypothetical protein
MWIVDVDPPTLLEDPTAHPRNNAFHFHLLHNFSNLCNAVLKTGFACTFICASQQWGHKVLVDQQKLNRYSKIRIDTVRTRDIFDYALACT